MEVQKRGNHGTLSAQLHNEKSHPLVVSILHVMFSVPVAEPLALNAGIPAQDSLSERQKEKKQLINVRFSEK